MDSVQVYLLTSWGIWNRQRQWQKPKKHVDWQGRVIPQDFTQIWLHSFMYCECKHYLKKELFLIFSPYTLFSKCLNVEYVWSVINKMLWVTCLIYIDQTSPTDRRPAQHLVTSSVSCSGTLSFSLTILWQRLPRFIRRLCHDVHTENTAPASSYS